MLQPDPWLKDIFRSLGWDFLCPRSKKYRLFLLSKICRRNDYLSIFGPQAGLEYSNKLPQRFFKSFLSLKNKIIIKPADKGGLVVVMAVLQYESKCNLLLQDTDTCQPLTINLLPKLTRTFNAIVKENIPSNLINVIKKTFLSLSYFYGIPKVYKQRVPIRPIIFWSGSITSHLSKWLAKLVTPLFGTISGAHIKDSSHYYTH